jgi:hypothetical protein
MQAVGSPPIYLNHQLHPQKSILTVGLALGICMINGFVKLMPEYMGPQLMPIENSAFYDLFDLLTFLSFN